MSLLGPLARDRHPDRRRDRGAREHRAPRGDGEGPLSRPHARAPTRSGWRSRRRPSRSSRCSCRSRSCPGVAGQWFKPFALTIACSVLVSLFVSLLARPDALGLLARSADRGAASGADPITRALDRFNAWFDRQAERYKSVIALGARPPLDDGWRSAPEPFFGAHLSLPAHGLVGAGLLPGERPDRVQLHRRDAAGLEPRVHPAQGGGSGAARPGPPGGALHLHHHRHGRFPCERRAWTRRLVYVRLMPKTERRDLAGRDGPDPARARSRKVGGVSVSVFTSGFGGAIKQIQLQLRGPDAIALTQLAEQVQHEVQQVPGAVDVGLSTKGQKPELEVELEPRARRLAGHHGGPGGAVAAAGVRRDRRRRLGGSERRDPRRDGPARARGSTAAGRPGAAAAGAVRGATEAPRPRSRWARWRRSSKGWARRRSTTSIATRWSASRPTCRGALIDEVTNGINASTGQAAAPAGLRAHPGRRGQRPEGGLRPHLHRAGRRGAADVPHPGDAVRLVPRLRWRS